MDWGVHIKGLGYGGKIEGTLQYIRGKQVIIMGRGIGVMEGISGGLGNLPWGCRHQVWCWVTLKDLHSGLSLLLE